MASSLLYEWQKTSLKRPRYHDSGLSEDAENYLKTDNRWLKELQQEYSKFGKQVMIPLVWTDDFVTADDIKYFRGDNGWVWQLKGHNMSVVNYILTTYYIKSIDNLGLLEKLEEDGRFGAFTFLVGE